jgi:putative cardiolipin synthase
MRRPQGARCEHNVARGCIFFNWRRSFHRTNDYVFCQTATLQSRRIIWRFLSLPNHRVPSLRIITICRQWASVRSASRYTVALLALATLFGCAGLLPGADIPKAASVALAHPEDTRLGQHFAGAAHDHGEDSAFRIISVGVDGFQLRMQMIDAAQRTLDLQYFIFRGDETGRMLTDGLQRAALRGVRIRVLVDDGDTVAGDEQILRLLAYPSVEVRIFNPSSYRGHSRLLRTLEFLLNAPRLDYRMHNKLFVADNALALIGGRNIGNQYFQVDPESQFADDDVLTAGPIVSQLSGTFDEFWNSKLAVPAKSLGRTDNPSSGVVARTEHQPASHESQAQPAKSGAVDYASLLKTGEPYAGIINGRLPLVWAHAQLVHDSPEKKKVRGGERAGSLIGRAVVESVREVQSELLMITPYFVPAADEFQSLKNLRQRQARVRVVTNSLESTTELAAQSGYDHYRVPLLKEGVELYEIRSLLGNVRGSGQTATVSRFGNYSLHGKMYVFDRQKLLLGSMNYDQRSKRINTEIGLIIDSKELAQQTAMRFEAMAKPENCYIVALSPAVASGRSSRMLWRSEEDGHAIEYTREPARNDWQRLKLNFLSLLPLDREL